MWKRPSPGFVAISRGHAIARFFNVTRRPDFVAILREPVILYVFRRSHGSHFLSIFCVITSKFLFFEKIAKSENVDIYDDPHRPRSFFLRSLFTKSHFSSIFCVRTLFSQKIIFGRYLQCFSKMGIREIFWGQFGDFGDLFFEFFVDILRVHALFQVFRKKNEKADFVDNFA